MEDARHNVELVHVLRRSFRPSDQLEHALEAFIQPGHVQPRFLIKTLSSLVLDSTVNHSLGLHKARQEAEQQSDIELQLGSRLAARRMASGALKIFMGLDTTLDEQGKDVNWLNYLTLINRTKHFVPDARLERDMENKDFAFYITIGPGSALPQDEIINPGRALLAGLKSPATKRLYTLTPESLSISNEERDVIPDFEQPFEQAS